jgi:hypothetical protein
MCSVKIVIIFFINPILITQNLCFYGYKDVSTPKNECIPPMGSLVNIEFWPINQIDFIKLTKNIN